MRVALYPRVSGMEQATEGYSIGEQIDRMKKYCEAKDWMVYKIYTDAGYSGANMARPGLQSMIKDIENKNVDMVLVYKLDRLSRSQKDTLYLIEDVFEKHDVGFSSMTENFDTSTPHGKFIIGILSVFSQLERERIKERTMLGKDARAEEGKWHGGAVQPIGYDYINDELVQNEYEVMQINDIADMFLNLTPIKQIERICDEKGYRHKHGEWDAKTIRRVLQTPLNIGLIKNRDRLFKGKHKPIFTQEKYDRIIELFNQRREKYGVPQKAHTTLLGGLIYCKHCGGKYGKNTNGSGQYYYTCYSRSKKVKGMIKDPNCKNKTHKMLDLDFMIVSFITQLALDPDYIEQVREDKPKNDMTEKIKTIKKEIAKIDEQISKLMDLYSLGSMPLDVISKKVADLNNTKTALDKELTNLDIPEDDTGMSNEMVQNLAELINDKDLDLEDKRKIVQSLIYYIEIDEENIYIHWKF